MCDCVKTVYAETIPTDSPPTDEVIYQDNLTGCRFFVLQNGTGVDVTVELYAQPNFTGKKISLDVKADDILALPYDAQSYRVLMKA